VCGSTGTVNNNNTSSSAGSTSGKTSVGLTRHHVIPREYRQWFPAHMKRHNSHDIVLMCLPCHNKYELTAAAQFKRELEKLYCSPNNSSATTTITQTQVSYETATQSNETTSPVSTNVNLLQDLQQLKKSLTVLLKATESKKQQQQQEASNNKNSNSKIVIMIPKPIQVQHAKLVQELTNRCGIIVTSSSSKQDQQMYHTLEQLLDQLALLNKEAGDELRNTLYKLWQLTVQEIEKIKVTQSTSKNIVEAIMKSEQHENENGNEKNTATTYLAKLEQFAQQWREHFILHTQPKYLNEHWQIAFKTTANTTMANEEIKELQRSKEAAMPKE